MNIEGAVKLGGCGRTGHCALAVLLLACTPPALLNALQHAFTDALAAPLPLFFHALAFFVVRGLDDLEGMALLELY